jgi:hypothetical protein
MLLEPRELSELALNRFWRDIFALAIPTSGTRGARRVMVVSLQTRLSQTIFFSRDCELVSHKVFCSFCTPGVVHFRYRLLY